MAVRTLLKKMSLVWVIVFALVSQTSWSMVNTQQAHQIIKQQYHDLLGDGRDLVSLYFFGSDLGTSVIGLERVGDDFLPVRWILIFRGELLLGWYHPVNEFPKGLSQGKLQFPKGLKADDVSLYPQPQTEFQLQGNTVRFKPAK